MKNDGLKIRGNGLPEQCWRGDRGGNGALCTEIALSAVIIMRFRKRVCARPSGSSTDCS